MEVCEDAVRFENCQRAQERHLLEPVWADGHEPSEHVGFEFEFEDGDWPCVFDLDGCE